MWLSSLPNETQDHIFSYVDRHTVREVFLCSHRTYTRARARIWSQVSLATDEQVAGFYDFATSSADGKELTRHTKTLKIRVPEPYNDVPILFAQASDPSNVWVPSDEDRYWSPKSFDVRVLERLLHGLPSIRVLEVVTYRVTPPQAEELRVAEWTC